MATTNTTPKEPHPPMWKVWLLASRPHTLTASISPVLVGHYCTISYLSVAPHESTWQWLVFCICVQLGTNLHNDYADYIRGADTQQRVGQARATQKGWLTPRQTCVGSCVVLSIALAIGLELIRNHNPRDPILWCIILSSIFNAFAYTGGPFPLGYLGLGDNFSIAYSGLGDMFCFVYFGLVAVLFLPYLYANEWNELGECVWVACPVGFLATAIIVVNNTRDRHTDIQAKKRTVAVRFGETFCRVEYTLLVVSSYAISILVENWLPLYSLPLAVSQIHAMWTKDGPNLNPHVGGTARLQLVFCILTSISLRQEQASDVATS